MRNVDISAFQREGVASPRGVSNATYARWAPFPVSEARRTARASTVFDLATIRYSVLDGILFPNGGALFHLDLHGHFHRVSIGGKTNRGVHIRVCGPFDEPAGLCIKLHSSAKFVDLHIELIKL